MEFSRTGIILNTEQFSACKRFYGEILGLELLGNFGSGDDEIVVFDLGGAYLMIEAGGRRVIGRKTVDECPTKFRFNVDDVDAAYAELWPKASDANWFGTIGARPSNSRIPTATGAPCDRNVILASIERCDCR